MHASTVATVLVLTGATCACMVHPPDQQSRVSEGTVPHLDSEHEDVAIHVYVSPDGEASLRNGAIDYPIGTIILKQKLRGVRHDATELFTGMLKRESGYNPECGDWEFFTLTGDARRVIARGRIESCMDCHTAYADSGFVARDYLTDSHPRPAVQTSETSELVPAALEREWRDGDLAAAALSRS